VRRERVVGTVYNNTIEKKRTWHMRGVEHLICLLSLFQKVTTLSHQSGTWLPIVRQTSELPYFVYTTVFAPVIFFMK
jgi:hypothetical protein